jgi:hypothetical protein
VCLLRQSYKTQGTALCALNAEYFSVELGGLKILHLLGAGRNQSLIFSGIFICLNFALEQAVKA